MFVISACVSGMPESRCLSYMWHCYKNKFPQAIQVTQRSMSWQPQSVGRTPHFRLAKSIIKSIK